MSGTGRLFTPCPFTPMLTGSSTALQFERGKGSCLGQQAVADVDANLNRIHASCQQRGSAPSGAARPMPPSLSLLNTPTPTRQHPTL
eukprot:366369-Chlamydomonas_euryale.AAC.7